ncbi:unnamed protein product [Ixodes pacificus]
MCRFYTFLHALLGMALNLPPRDTTNIMKIRFQKICGFPDSTNRTVSLCTPNGANFGYYFALWGLLISGRNAAYVLS